MTGPPGDRAAGAVLVAAALAVALEAGTFDVAFPTDPLGPKAFPLLAAVILGGGGFLLLVRPGDPPPWPPSPAWIRMGLATATFLVYPLLLAPLGFGVATTLEVTVLALLFRGSPVPSLAGAVAFTGLLWILFVHGLALPLPVGALWTGGP